MAAPTGREILTKISTSPFRLVLSCNSKSRLLGRVRPTKAWLILTYVLMARSHFMGQIWVAHFYPKIFSSFTPSDFLTGNSSIPIEKDCSPYFLSLFQLFPVYWPPFIYFYSYLLPQPPCQSISVLRASCVFQKVPILVYINDFDSFFK